MGLNLKGVITFKEMISSLRKGSLRRQIQKLADDRFDVVSEMGPITIQSVKVSIEDDCIRIMPEMAQRIETEGEKEQIPQAKRYMHQCQVHNKPSISKGPGSETKRRVKRDSVKDEQHKLIEHTRLVTPSAQRQLINNELENCLARRRQQARNDDVIPTTITWMTSITQRRHSVEQ